MPPQCGRPARSTRLESLGPPAAVGAVALLDEPPANVRADELYLRHGVPGERASLVSSVTRAPRAPPR